MAGVERADRLRHTFWGCLVDAYTENCGRFSDDLGDNSLTFAISVIHNLRHLLEEALVDEPGISVARPGNSFQIEVDSRLAIHFYKAPSGPADVGEIRFDESKKKLQLIAENSAQLALVFEEGDGLLSTPEPHHLIVVHAGTPALGLLGAWIGAPMVSSLNGPIWLWREPLRGRRESPVANAPRVPAWADEASLPELVVELRQDGEQRPTADEAS